MNRLLSSETEQRNGLSTQILLKFVLAYEDYEIGKRAKAGLDHVMRGLGNRIAFVNSSWKFTVLDNPDLREIAASDAADADIIVIGAYEGRDLPPSVGAWINAWRVRRNGEKGCLLAVLGDDDDQLGSASPVGDHLQKIAAEEGMDFLIQKTPICNSRFQGIPAASDAEAQKVMRCWAHFLRVLRLPEPKS